MNAFLTRAALALAAMFLMLPLASAGNLNADRVLNGTANIRGWDTDDAVWRSVFTVTSGTTPAATLNSCVIGGTTPLAGTFTTVAATTVSVGGTNVPAATRFTVYGAGTKYALTNTAAAVDLGTTDPVITITTAGTYRISGRVKLTYTGATVVAETATVKLRRTNNTAADLTGASEVIDLPAATTLTHDWGWVPFEVYYTTANVDDAITIFANVSAALGAGTIDVNACNIVAQRVE